jgi:UDP-N-acetylmuramate--alanine ligase
MEKVFFCGIKGTGMSNLALILQRMGYEVSGCDKKDFYSTQNKLYDSNINIFESFNKDNIDLNIKFFIYSSAYEKSELVEYSKLKYECFSYPQFLARLTKNNKSYAVCGTHGKTTVSALTTYALSQGKRKKFPFFSIYGSNIIGEDDVCFQGVDNILIEGCEYQDHFLLYKTDGILITNIEFDHPDYFKDLNLMIESYKKLILNVKQSGFVILNTDNYNSSKLEAFIKGSRADLILITYGYKKIATVSIENTINGGEVIIPMIYRSSYKLPVRNKDLMANYVGAGILSSCILLDRENPNLYLDENAIIFEEILITLFNQSMEYLQDFTGVSRRLEFISGDGDVLYFDDYAHHPTEIETVYNELRFRFPTKQILTIFTPHTASRTKAMMNDFVRALMMGDKLILTPTFSSARENCNLNDPSFVLFNRIQGKIDKSKLYSLNSVYYLGSDEDFIKRSCMEMTSNYICLILGAANKTYLIDEIIKFRTKNS